MKGRSVIAGGYDHIAIRCGGNPAQERIPAGNHCPAGRGKSSNFEAFTKLAGLFPLSRALKWASPHLIFAL